MQEIKRVGGLNFTIQRRLAEGGFGLVDLVAEIGSNREMVLKRCYLTRPESFTTANKEIRMLQTFASPYVVKLLASDIQIGTMGAQEALILLEFCGKGHLLDRLNRQNGDPFPMKEIYRIFGQILLAIQPMHDLDPPVIHRDLKLENVLFADDENIRLCDFGSCCVGYTDIKSYEKKAAVEEVLAKETTQMYRAPEMCDLYMRDQLTEKSDIWALGCILYALCFLFHPFQDQGSLGILSGKIKIPDDNSAIEEVLQNLILRMLDMDPEARPSVREIFNYVRALAKSEPAPTLELTDEAKLWKERRIKAEKKREMKATKKAKAPIVPSRAHKSTFLDPNSAAAKRLAIKRGDPGTSEVGIHHQFPISSSHSSSFLSATKHSTLDYDVNLHDSSTDFNANFEASATADMAVSDFDLSFDVEFEGSTPCSQLFLLSPATPTSPHTVLQSDANVNVSILDACVGSSPDKSSNSSLNASLIDLDF